MQAAKALFSEKGYDAVSMREIARKAKCSHTAIYMYFQDKRALLHEIAVPPLEDLKMRMEEALRKPTRSADERLTDLALMFVRFSLENRSMVPLLFLTEAGPVDEAEPPLPVNRLRNALFSLLMQNLSESLGLDPDDPRLLQFSRIAFFALFGIVSTFIQGGESADQLFERLKDTFSGTIAVLLAGFRAVLQENREAKVGQA